MGQKVNPIGIRLGINKPWLSRWYGSHQTYRETVLKDLEVRKYLKQKLSQASVSRVEIERPARNAIIRIYSARPGVIIGKSGRDIDLLRNDLSEMMNVPVQINIEEVRKPELDAQLVADNIAGQLLSRVAFRRAMKKAMSTAMHAGAQGIKVSIAGRLGGAEIARTEWAKEGRVPLQTFRADIDFGFSEALAPYGILGIKVWIFKGEIFGIAKEE